MKNKNIVEFYAAYPFNTKGAAVRAEFIITMDMKTMELKKVKERWRNKVWGMDPEDEWGEWQNKMLDEVYKSFVYRFCIYGAGSGENHWGTYIIRASRELTAEEREVVRRIVVVDAL